MFQPGRVEAAFTVEDIPLQSNVVWILSFAGKTKTTTAGSSFSTTCTTPPPPTPTVSIFVTCVDNGASTFSATFGYNNSGSTTLFQAIGPNNGFAPDPDNRGQPTAFPPGRQGEAFRVTGIPNGTNLVWNLRSNGGRTTTASASFATKCGTDPPDPPDPPTDAVRIFVECVTNGSTTFSARFGYLNENDVSVAIPVGSNNRFVPAPQGRGQTTVFAAGRVSPAFTVDGIPNGTNLVWIVSFAGSTRTTTASATFTQKCTGPEPPDPPDPPDPRIRRIRRIRPSHRFHRRPPSTSACSSSA